MVQGRVLRGAVEAGLAEYDELEGIAWRWQSIDAAMFKAPLAHNKPSAPIRRTGEKTAASAIFW